MGEKDDGLALDLALRCSASAASPQKQQNQNQPSVKLDLITQSDRNPEEKSLPRGIDMNRPPSTADCEDETDVSSPNSTVSSISGKRSEREGNGDENGAKRVSCSSGGEEEGSGDPSRKKLRLSKEQSLVLEETFKDHHTLNPKQKLALAKQLNMRTRQVEVWFQNKRARTKLKQTEVDYEYLKRCCENLTEENKRLQTEVKELRALKLSPHLYANPPTTLTMCPSCERLALSSSSSSSSSPAAAPTRLPITNHHRLITTLGLHCPSTSGPVDALAPSS